MYGMSWEGEWKDATVLESFPHPNPAGRVERQSSGIHSETHPEYEISVESVWRLWSLIVPASNEGLSYFNHPHFLTIVINES